MIKFIKSNIFFLLLVSIIVFIIYGKSINFNIINLDDDSSISRNINFISNFKNIYKLFITDCYYQGASSYYRPVLTTTFAIETLLFGYNTKIYHLTNILLFIFSIYLIYLFFIKLKVNRNILIWVLLLFLVHPIFVSNIVYISPRGETLLTIFTILSLLNFIKYIETNRFLNLILLTLFFFLALFTKESAIMLIILIPIFLYSFKYKLTKKQCIKISIINFVILIFYFLLRTYSVQKIPFVINIDNISHIILNIFYGIVIYINKLLIPDYIPMILFNPIPTIKEIIIFIVFILLLFLIYYKKIIDKEIIIFGISIFLLYILPSFCMMDNQILFHRLLLPSTGFLLIFIFLLQHLLNKFQIPKKILIFAQIILFILFSYSCFIQQNRYKDSITFFENAYIDATNYHIICSGLSKEYINIKEFEKANILALKALELNNCFDNYLTYAIVLFKSGDITNSKPIFLQLLEHDTNPLIYMYLSDIYLFEKDFTLSIEYAKKAVDYSHKNIDKTLLLENLAKIYSVIGNYKESLNIVLGLYNNNKTNSSYCYLISMLYEDLKDFDNAKLYIKEAIKIEPTNESYIEQLQNIESKLLTK